MQSKLHASVHRDSGVILVHHAIYFNPAICINHTRCMNSEINWEDDIYSVFLCYITVKTFDFR
jgi:hypothetical protein